MISVTGEAGGRGVRCGVSVADMVAGMYAAFGIMNALRVKDRTGRGQYVDVAMLDGQLGILSGMIGAYLADGEMPAPMGTAYKALLPYQTFRTKTRDLALAVGSDKLWKTFCPLMGLDDWMDDPRFATNRARAANRVALIGRLQDLRGVGGHPPSRGHPQGRHQHHRPGGGAPPGEGARDDRGDRPPDGGKGQDGRRAGEAVGDAGREPAPTLGQHTDEVLRAWLGLSDAAIAELRRTGALGARHDQ
jgi:formyl-CoA transferase/CoA:oxalate CoA-transferase